MAHHVEASPQAMVQLIKKICELESLVALQRELVNAGSVIFRFAWRQVFAAGRIVILYAQHAHRRLNPFDNLTELLAEKDLRILLKGLCTLKRITRLISSIF